MIGCPDVPVDSNTQFKRTEDGAELSCVAGGDIWNIKCVDRKWTGNLVNCTSGGGQCVHVCIPLNYQKTL